MEPVRPLLLLALIAPLTITVGNGCDGRRGAREVKVSTPSRESPARDAAAATKPPPAIATH